jgi:hypothetical protein
VRALEKMSPVEEFASAIAADLARIWRGYSWPKRIIWLALLLGFAAAFLYGMILGPDY